MTSFSAPAWFPVLCDTREPCGQDLTPLSRTATVLFTLHAKLDQGVVGVLSFTRGIQSGVSLSTAQRCFFFLGPCWQRFEGDYGSGITVARSVGDTVQMKPALYALLFCRRCMPNE